MNKFRLFFNTFILCVIFSTHIKSSFGQNVSEKDSLIPSVYEYSCNDAYLDTIHLVFGSGFAGDKVVVSHYNNVLFYSHVFYDSIFNHIYNIYYLENQKELKFNIGVSEFNYHYNVIWSPFNEEDARVKVIDEYNYPQFFYAFQYLDIKINPSKGKYIYLTFQHNSKSKNNKSNLVRPYSRLELKYEQLDKLPDLNK